MRGTSRFSALAFALILVPVGASASERASARMVRSIRTQDHITEVRLKGQGAQAAAERLQLIGGGKAKRGWFTGTYVVLLPAPTMLGPTEKMIRAAVNGDVPRDLLDAARMLKQRPTTRTPRPSASSNRAADDPPARTMAGTFDPSHVQSLTDPLSLY